MGMFKRVFGDPNQKVIKLLHARVQEINDLEQRYRAMSDEDLRKQTEVFRTELGDDIGLIVLESAQKRLDAILPRAFAVVREAARRTLGQRHFDAQLMGGIVLNNRSIAEMKTGEGKTLTSTLALYVNALAGRGTHLVTVNDYLARRDASWMGQVYHFLGLTVACLQQNNVSYLFDSTLEEDIKVEDDAEKVFRVDQKHLRPCSRQEAYRADITYGINSEFGFDYLRDNMVPETSHRVQRELFFALIDEVDSILIDEARTPLIISAPDIESTEKYYQFARIATTLRVNEDYTVDEKLRAVSLTEQGIKKCEKASGVQNIYTEDATLAFHLDQALKAEVLFKRDKEYVVQNGEVLIVDEFTGRIMQGRRYSQGLHQAIEAKEGVEIQKESRTLATITIQNYFRMYTKLAGMTGTAATEAEEFHKIYALEVTQIPTNKPMIREDQSDLVYASEQGKFQALAHDIQDRQKKGQPVLVGTVSIAKSEKLSEILDKMGVAHNVLNAKQHEREAEIIAQAGRRGAVTVATNMAGRGVDIILGGVPCSEQEAKKVKDLGGLAVLGSERHESRRIDNQLRGRSGRQGDRGESRFYLSMEDELMRIFGSDRVKKMMQALGMPEDMPIQNKMVTKSIESAQKKVEGMHFDTRKHLLEYDDVLNRHRLAIYNQRNDILDRAEGRSSQSLREIILEMMYAELDQIVAFHTADKSEGVWDLKEIYDSANAIFPLAEADRKTLEQIRAEAGTDAQDIHARDHLLKFLSRKVNDAYDEFERAIGNKEVITQIERGVLFQNIDSLWMDHLEAIDHLRHGIGLVGYGQRDPLVEYKKETYRLFGDLQSLIRHQVVTSILKTAQSYQKMLEQNSILEKYKQITLSAPSDSGDSSSVITSTQPSASGFAKVGRNEPCPCGSGVKYKRCHGNI